MKVLKFGSSSLSSVQKMKDVARLVQKGESKIVVFSALAGTTDSLMEISDYLMKRNTDAANEVIVQTEAYYHALIDDLYETASAKAEAKEAVRYHFNELRLLTKDLFTLFEKKAALAQGELLSSSLMYILLKEDVDAVMLPALDFMRVDKNAEPDTLYIKENIQKLLKDSPRAAVYVTQGYICRNPYGEIDSLERGGSDLSASLIGAAIQAEEIQIWTDIDDMQNNDPRYVEKTSPIEQLQFDEAAELAYFGSKVLHPTCLLPAKLANIPVRLLNTMHPDAPGTLISNEMRKGTIKAVAVKDDITAIKVKSGQMLMAYGFLRKVFEIFESYQTPIDMVTTSEVGVSVTIDKTKHLDDILDELRKYGSVTVDRDMSLICVVGDLDWNNIGFESKAIQALQDIPVRMISYGGSNYNISFLINSRDTKKALQALSNQLFS